MIKYLLTFALMIPLLVSCSNDDIVIKHDESKTEDTDISSLYLKIDSLNAKYSELNEVCSSRGYCSDYAISASADAVGGFIGKKLFSWVGASIGAACANPVVAVGGYLVGRQVGKAAGSAAASIGAAWIMDHCFSRSSSTHSLILDKDYVVDIKDPDNLSDGELHNLIVAKLLNNIDKYITISGDLNYELLVEDAFAFENEFCPIDEYSEFKSLCIPQTVEQTKRIVKSSLLLINNNNEAFLDDVYNNLIPEIQVTKVEFENANILNRKSLSTYMVLDNKNIVDYSKDINYVIDNSNLDNNLKADLKSSNDLLLNSTLIWREVK